MNTLLNITIKCFLLCLCLSVCEAYGQKVQTLKREPLTNGDTAVWVRDSLGRIGIYFQKEHERYVDLFHYRDTAKTDARSVWTMYQSLCKPQIRDVQKELGSFLVDYMKSKSVAMPDTVDNFNSFDVLTVRFMLDRKGRITAMGPFIVPEITNWPGLL